MAFISENPQSCTSLCSGKADTGSSKGKIKPRRAVQGGFKRLSMRPFIGATVISLPPGSHSILPFARSKLRPPPVTTITINHYQLPLFAVQKDLGICLDIIFRDLKLALVQ